MPKFTDLPSAGALTGTEITALVVNVTGTLTSEQATLSQIQTYVLSGNAASATKLATARTINGINFDGSANITIPTTIPAATSSALGGVIIPATSTSGIVNNLGTINIATASPTQLGGVLIDGTTITVNGSNQIQYSLPIATGSVLGGVKQGTNVTIDGSGVISVPTGAGYSYTLPVATGSVLGGVKQGNNVTIDVAGVISVAAPYSLPAATSSSLGGVQVQSALISGLVNTAGSIVLAQASSTQLGGVKIGTGITIAGDGTISTTVYSLPQATTTTLGGVKVDGSTIVANSGVISSTISAATTTNLGGVTVAATSTSGLILSGGGALSLGVATSSQLGGVIVDGTTIAINSSTISVPLFSATKIAIGSNAGSTGQGTNSVAIGAFAGQTNQPANTIILNASGSAVNGVVSQTSSFYVNPIRSTTPQAGFVYYNSNTYEVVYSTSLGYPTGSSSGGAVTQTGSRTNSVTLNKLTGQITLLAAAGSATPATFTVSNTTVTAVDTVIVNCSSSTNVYLTFVTAVAANSFNITYYTTGGVTSDSPVFNFTVIKGSNN